MVKSVVQVNQLVNGIYQHIAGVGDFRAVFGQRDAAVAFANVMVRAHRRAVLDFVAGTRAAPAPGRNVIQVKVPRCPDDCAVGHPVGKAAAPRFVVAELQKPGQHLPLRDQAGRYLKLRFREPNVRDGCLVIRRFARPVVPAGEFAGAVNGDDGSVGQNLLAGGQVVAIEQGQLGFIKLALEHCPGPGLDVAGHPTPAQAFRGHGDIGAAGKAVQHNVPFVGTGRNDAFRQRNRLLRRVAGALFGLRIEVRNALPPVGNSRPGRFPVHIYDPVIVSGGLAGDFGISLVPVVHHNLAFAPLHGVGFPTPVDGYLLAFGDVILLVERVVIRLRVEQYGIVVVLE